MKAISLALLMLVILPAKPYAVETDSSAKEHFYKAKEHIEDMLSGKAPLSYERAIYEVENAWYGGGICFTSFENALNFHEWSVRNLIENYRDNSFANSASDLLKTKEQKIQDYTSALANLAIYNYITKPTILLQGNNKFYHQPYSYSTIDPLGTSNWENTQVTNMLNNGTGNCFALASLFKILSERVNSKAILCTAPGHIYIRHSDDNGTYYNVELASRSFPGTGTIETVTYTPTEATKRGIALRELDLNQSVALCLVYLAKGYEQKFGNNDNDFLLSCAEMALQYDDLNLNAMLLKAEVLENKLIASTKDIEIMRKEKEFIEYQKWITHIFNLGYREMPYEMKNQIVKGLTRDTITYLKTQEHIPSRTKDTRYASLSWGLFDEEIRTKPLERFGNTAYDTKQKRIVAFLKEDVLYNHYNFDPVVFAWNIDPLAHKYPGISPYAFCYNNPINVVDPDGREGIVVSGQPGDHKNREHFLTNGLNRARIVNKQFAAEGNGEQVTWLIYNGGGKGGYDQKTIDKYTQLGAKYGVAVQVVSSADKIVEYVNDKNGGDSRANDKVSNFYYLGHATPGDLDVGFENHGRWNMLTNDKIEPSDFNSDAFRSGANINVVGGCQTAVDGNLMGEKSVIGQFADKVDTKSTIKGSNVRVYYPGGNVSDEELVKPNNGSVIQTSGNQPAK